MDVNSNQETPSFSLKSNTPRNDTTNLNISTEISSSAKKRWKLVGNVIRSVFILKNRDARVIDDVDDMLNEVRESPTLPQYSRGRSLFDNTISAIDDHKLTDNLFSHLARSSKRDLVEIERIIENHPRRYTRNKSDPDSIVNKSNLFGIRPIYEAARNGHVQVNST